MGSLRSAASAAASAVQTAVNTARGEEPVAPPPAATATSSTSQRRTLTPEQRLARFERTLRVSPIPMAQLRTLCFIEGVPDGGASAANLRAITWKLLLGYLPEQHAQWQSHLESQRALYAAYLSELTVDPREKPDAAAAAAGGGASVVTDDPLSTAADSKWVEWHADEELRTEIQKDVDRTLPDYSFFNKEQASGRLHHGAISRVLFVYAKLNPGIRYVQGMNEVLAPIYYVFCLELEWARKASAEAAAAAAAAAASTNGSGEGGEGEGGGSGGGGGGGGGALDAEEEAAAAAAVEADAFFCFTNLMAEVRDHFCAKLDHTELGITAKIQNLEALLAQKDPELAALLKSLRVAPSFYGFRWLTLLMTQEFDLPDVLRLWDALLADTQRFEFLNYVAATMVMSMRDEFLEKNDFAFCVKKLQHYDNHLPIHALVAKAAEGYFVDFPHLKPENLSRAPPAQPAGGGGAGVSTPAAPA